MELTEYKQRIDELHKDFKTRKKEIDRLFALSNVKFKEGDIIKDNSETILIDKIFWGYDFSTPCAVYSGYCLKKDLTPRKDKSRANLYSNLEKIK